MDAREAVDPARRRASGCRGSSPAEFFTAQTVAAPGSRGTEGKWPNKLRRSGFRATPGAAAACPDRASNPSPRRLPPGGPSPVPGIDARNRRIGMETSPTNSVESLSDCGDESGRRARSGNSDMSARRRPLDSVQLPLGCRPSLHSTPIPAQCDSRRIKVAVPEIKPCSSPG